MNERRSQFASYGRAPVAAAALAVAMLCAMPSPAQYADTLWIPVTYYDYRADGSNPNFEPSGLDGYDAGLRTSMVRSYLSDDRKPLLYYDRTYNDLLNYWYRPSGIRDTEAAFTIDAATGRGTWSDLVNYQGREDEWVGRNYSESSSMRCIVLYDSLPFILADIRTGMYRYDDPFFLPIDGRGYGADPDAYPRYNWVNTGGHNYSFSMELHRDFVYRPGLKFEFTGDDDVWAFVNGNLEMDLGGIHVPLTDSVDMSSLGLRQGQIYHFDFFFAERHVTHSQLTVSANFLVGPYTSIVLVPVPSPDYDSTPLLRWHPGEISVTYTVQIATDPSFGSPLYQIDTRDTTLVAPALPVGAYYWRVRADNANYSASSMFVIVDPRVPIPLAVEPDPTADRHPILAWRSPPTAPAQYVVQVDTQDVFSSALVETTVTDTAYRCLPELPYGTVFWRVRAADTLLWSSTRSFRVVPDTVPRLVRFDGAPVAEPRPTLAWHPVPGAISYNVYVANNKAFHQAVVGKPADTTFVPPENLASTMWYWRVSSDLDKKLYSDIDSFVVAAVTTAGANGEREASLHTGAAGEAVVAVHDLRGRQVRADSRRVGCADLPPGAYVMTAQRSVRRSRLAVPLARQSLNGGKR